MRLRFNGLIPFEYEDSKGTATGEIAASSLLAMTQRVGQEARPPDINVGFIVLLGTRPTKLELNLYSLIPLAPNQFMTLAESVLSITCGKAFTISTAVVIVSVAKTKNEWG